MNANIMRKKRRKDLASDLSWPARTWRLSVLDSAASNATSEALLQAIGAA